MLPASTVNHETAAAGDDVSVVWTWDVPYRWRVAIDVRGATLPSPVRATRGGAADRKPHHRSASTASHRGTLLPLVGMTLATPYRHRTATDFYMLEGTVRLRFSWGDRDQSTATRGDQPRIRRVSRTRSRAAGHPARGARLRPDQMPVTIEMACSKRAAIDELDPELGFARSRGWPTCRNAYTEALGKQRSREIGGLVRPSDPGRAAPTATTCSKAATGREG